MKLPGPITSLARLLPARPTAKSIRLVLAAGALFTACFLLALYLFFPEEALRQRLEREVQIRSAASIEVTSLEASFPLALRLDNVSVRPERPEGVELVIDRLRLAPVWHSLLGGDPRLNVDARFFGGSLQGEVAKSGAVDGRLEGVQLKALPPLPGMAAPFRPVGVLDASISATGPLLADRQTAELDLLLESAALEGLEVLGVKGGRLSLGRVSARGSLKGRRLDLSELKIEGGDLLVNGKGNIIIGTTPARSRISMQLTLQPGAGLDPGLADLLSLTGVKPAGDGSYRLRISGSLASPRLR